MKKFINPFQGSFANVNLFCVALYSLFITFFLIHESAKLVSFELTDLSAIYISEATAWGIDVSLRVTWMYRLIFGCAALFIVFFFLLKRTLKNCNYNLIKHEDLILFALSGIVLCVMRVFGTDSTHILSSLFFIFSFKLILVILSHHNIKIPRYLLHSGILNLSISFAFLFLFACVFLFGTTNAVHKNYSTILFVGNLAFLFYYFLTLHVFKIGPRKATACLLPLIGIPFVAVLSVETFFYKKLISGEMTNYHHNFVFLFTLFALIVIGLLFISRKKRVSSFKQYKRYIIPSLLFCFVVITAYEPVIDNIPDLFEPGNILNSLTRVFEFKQIPLLDFVSSHMLSEQWYSYIYSFIYGFHNDLSPLTFSFLNGVIFVYVQYLLLYHLFKREAFALAFIFFFPFLNDVFYSTVLIAVVPFFFMRDLFEKPSPFKIFKLLLICCLLLVWRIDTGVVAIIGNVFFLPVMHFLYSKKMPFKIILKGISYFLGFGVFIFGICCILRTPQKVFDSIQLFYHYIAGSQAHGHHSVFNYETHQFYIYHVLLPIVAVGIILFGIYLLKTKYENVIFNRGYLLLATLYLLIMYLVHLQRGLIRHGFPELEDGYIISVFHVSLALFITFLFSRELAIKNFMVFYCSTFVLFLLIKYFPINIAKIPIENGITENRFYNNKKPFDNPAIEGRILMDSGFANKNYAGLNSFMNTYLKKDQTFFDFSNTSLLYFYCNRRIPGYFNQNLQNTIDDYLQLKLLDELAPEKVPMVIYSSYPPNVNDGMDEIPNVMRHYILAEHVFVNYEPLGILNNKSIWVSKKLVGSIKDSFPGDLNLPRPQPYQYKLNAEYIGYYYSTKNSTDLESLFKLDAKNFTESDNALTFKLPNNVSRQPHCYLQIEFKKLDHAIKSYPITVELLNDSLQLNGSFTFERRDKVSNKYMLRLSNHYLWHLYNTSAIRISKDFDIKSIELLKDKRLEHKTANIN